MLIKALCDYSALQENKTPDWNDPKFSDKADAVFYRPHMIDGVIDVAKYREEIKC